MTTPQPGTDPDQEPDYRFTLANERTFLAWVRTCLALLAGAVALDQFAAGLGSRTFREVCAVTLALLATATAGAGLVRWVSTQRAIRRGAALRPGVLPALIAVGLGAVTLAVLVVLLADLLG